MTQKRVIPDHCPFCGSHDISDETKYGYCGHVEGWDNPWKYVTCNDCEAEIPVPLETEEDEESP